jgi:hypothetical protein
VVQEAVKVDTVLSAFLHVYLLYPVECNDFEKKLDDPDTFVKNLLLSLPAFAVNIYVS